MEDSENMAEGISLDHHLSKMELERASTEEEIRYKQMVNGRRIKEKLFPDTVVPPQYFVYVVAERMKEYYARFLVENNGGERIPADIRSHEELTEIVLRLSDPAEGEKRGYFFLEGRRRVYTPEGSLIPLHIVGVYSPAAVSNIYVSEVSSVSFGLDRRKGRR